MRPIKSINIVLKILLVYDFQIMKFITTIRKGLSHEGDRCSPSREFSQNNLGEIPLVRDIFHEILEINYYNKLMLYIDKGRGCL